MNPLTDSCLRYLDGDLSESEARDFDRLVAESPDAARELARHLIDEHYFAKIQHVEHHRRIDAAHASDASAIQSAVRHLDRKEESEEVLRELLRMECEASPLPRLKDADLEGANKSRDSEPPVQGKVADAALYLLNQAARSPRVRWLAAALVLLSAALIVAFLLHDPGDSGPAFTDRAEENTAQPTTTPLIATLTAVDGARWVSGDGLATPRLGDALAAGQRLTLEGGTAQITTERGAIANLQAPCHIELLEDGNGLRLMYGRLVGICETQASKGFLVRTPEVDVTDLGTRFGVDATRPNVTQVHVFEGEVNVAPPGKTIKGQQQLLTTGQAITAGSDDSDFVAVELDIQRFAALQEIELTGNSIFSPLAGVQRIAGDLTIASRETFVAKSPDQWPSSSGAYLFREFVSRAPADLPVNMVQPESRTVIGEVLTAMIPANTPLSSYIIVARPPEPESNAIVRGSATFDGEILGLIAEASRAENFEKTIGGDVLFKPGDQKHGWLDPNNFDEYIMLSKDRRSITFSLKAKRSIDTLRVLVHNEVAEDLP